jgi:hypothetical protein
MMRAAIWLACVTACGRIDFTSHPSDAAPPRCLAWGAFDAPVLVPDLSTIYDDWSPVIVAGGTIAFSSDWGPGFAIGQRTRASIDDPWSAVVRLALGSGMWALHPSATPDGRSLYTDYEDPATGDTNIAQATRIDATTFSVPVVLESLRSANYNHEPHISTDELRLYYATNHLVVGDNGMLEIVVATRADPSAEFAAPVVLTELDTPSSETSPTLTADELEIIFSSNRPGDAGQFDLYRATRTSLAEPFSNIEPLTALNTPLDDLGAELSLDGSTLTFNRGAQISGGNAEVWQATRPCLQTAP